MSEYNQQQSKQNVRLLAVKALADINRKGAYANIVLQQYISQSHMEDLDRRFFTELVYGVVRRKNYLDAIIVHLAKRPLNKLSSLVVEILRLGIYQIIYMDKVPHSAAVNESVKLAKKLTRGLSGFVNAILRSAIRSEADITISSLATAEHERISFIYNQPLWLVKHWIREMGIDQTIDLCAWFNEQPRLTARINTLKISLADCIKQLEEAGWIISRDDVMEEVIYIEKHVGHLEKSPVVLDGYITFMDKASMLVAHIVDPQRGERILDCCAAPGGKTMHMATLMENTGEIIACDIHEHKLELMNDNAKRLGVSIVETRLQDATQLPEEWKESFHRVLVDAPCSGLGILQKKLDMRWRKEPSILTELPLLQEKIINKASEMDKSGGYLIYSTCTINREENDVIVERFLDSHSNFELDPIKEGIVKGHNEPMITINPPVDEMDGFFMARLRKL